MPGAPGASRAPGAPERDDPRSHSIPSLHSLTYDNSVSKRVDNYTMLPPRHYVNGPMDPDKINKFLKAWANRNK